MGAGKSMSWLQTAESVIGNDSLVGELHSALRNYADARSVSKIHMSDVTNPDRTFCPREFALCRQLDIPRKGRFIGAPLQATFDIGNAIHDLVRENWLGHLGLGHWRCVRCDFEHKFTYRPAACKSCGQNKHRFEYVEVELKDPDTLVSGSLDFLTAFGRKTSYKVVEVKSIDKDQFKTLEAPMAEHRLRVQGYLELAKRSAKEVPIEIELTYGYVLYASKSYGFKTDGVQGAGFTDTVSSFKEYRVDAAPEAIVPHLERALGVKEYETSGTLPGPICYAITETRAKQCSAAKHCFSQAYGGGQS